MKYFAVIDTNVLVSAALKWHSVPGSIIDLAFNGIIVPLLNEEIISEYETVLMRPKFHLNRGIVDDILHEMKSNGVFVTEETLEIELPDPKDRVFYEVTMEFRKSEESYLVTGNLKHFPRESFVVSPREMLDIILKDSNEQE